MWLSGRESTSHTTVLVDVKRAALELPEDVNAPTDSPDINPETRTTEAKTSPADMRSVMELLFGSIMD